MKSALRLLLHSLKRSRGLLISMSLVLGAFQVMLTAVGRSIHVAEGFEQLSALIPPFAREAMGSSLASFMSFSGIVCFGYFDLPPVAAVVGLVISLSLFPTSEIETGFMDLVLARPVPRHAVITRTVLLIVLAAMIILCMMMAGTWIGLATLAPPNAQWPAKKMVLSLVVNLGLLALSWGGIAMAIGSVSRRRSVAGASAGLLALVAYLLDYLGRVWKPVEPYAWLSPFRYYPAFEIITGTPLAARNLIVLASIAVAGFVASYVLFSRRDI